MAVTRSMGYKVEVSGLRELYDAIKETDKKAANEINRVITQAGKQVAAEASYLIPSGNALSNWGPWLDAKRGRDLGFDASVVGSNFKVKRNNYRRKRVSAGIAWEVVQANAGGSIWALMGDGSPVTTPSGEHLVNVVNARFPGKQPRALLPAYYRVITPQLREKIRDTIVNHARRLGLR